MFRVAALGLVVLLISPMIEPIMLPYQVLSSVVIFYFILYEIGA